MTQPEDHQSLEPSLINIDRVIHEPARLIIMVTLSVVDRADYTFLMNQTGLTWGNLSSHMSKLEAENYVVIEKTFVGKKPHTMASLSDKGRAAFQAYRQQIDQVFDNLPD